MVRIDFSWIINPVQAKSDNPVLSGLTLPEGNPYPFILILSQHSRTPGGEPPRPLLVVS
jgi:hypothetical protein